VYGHCIQLCKKIEEKLDLTIEKFEIDEQMKQKSYLTIKKSKINGQVKQN
jgi:hypothetical protein